MSSYNVLSKVIVPGTVVEKIENEAQGVRYKVKIKSNDTLQYLWFEEDEIGEGKVDSEPTPTPDSQPHPEPEIVVSMIPESSSSVLFGTPVSDIQSNIEIKNNAVTGILKKLTTGDLVNAWGEGNFIAIKFIADDWAKYDSVKVGMNPSYGNGLVEIINDDDKNGAFKVTNKDEQRFEINVDGESIFYDLTGLVCES